MTPPVDAKRVAMQRYELLSKKGEGTFSEVVKARNRGNSKFYAIKCIKQQLQNVKVVREELGVSMYLKAETFIHAYTVPSCQKYFKGEQNSGSHRHRPQKAVAASEYSETGGGAVRRQHRKARSRLRTDGSEPIRSHLW